jgi:hypothetical protein
MKKLCMSAALAALTVLLFGNFSMQANNNDEGGALRFSTLLSTFNEVPPKANGAHGTFRAKLSEDGTTLSWTFTWSGLSGPPLFAHIHFGLKGGNYPVMTFFCGGPKGTLPSRKSLIARRPHPVRSLVQRLQPISLL